MLAPHTNHFTGIKAIVGSAMWSSCMVGVITEDSCFKERRLKCKIQQVVVVVGFFLAFLFAII